MMITAIVLYKLPPHIDLADCAAHFHAIGAMGHMQSRLRPGAVAAEHVRHILETGC